MGLNSYKLLKMFRFKKQERYYHVYKQQNFFGDITIISSWNTFDSKLGGIKSIFCNNQIETYSKYCMILNRLDLGEDLLYTDVLNLNFFIQ